jgi:hypothetical protein
MSEANGNAGFSLRPGDGWIFHLKQGSGTHLFQGHIKLAASDGDTKNEYHVRGRTSDDNSKYLLEVTTFGPEWKKLADLELPAIGDKSYVEGELNMPLEKPIEVTGVGKLTHRKYKVRAFRGKTRDGEPVLRLRFPDIIRDAEASSKSVIP